ncbi:hypothetical protein AAFF_G00436000 [Aldrovandia affinis]|uniref:DNA endonuclease Ctp1 N-terminal domain-containing protein n=1 Tax=Aldrovandia affinis TaxID=143900 RepID=A0AAD7WHV0_9TELE|nr:hypothetical protein AAFF_G00436000 [Aldrovandia affinis]
MALESFTELLHRLKDLHEREVEGWQEKFVELTNQKCCSDTKRMEELFTKNQLLRDQQRLLTENIKQLENRLRAGLCDRCTVTQDVAKRRQQEYESLQIQSLQHITVLVSEMNGLKKENKRLQDEVKNLRGVLDGQQNQGLLAPAPDVSQTEDHPMSAVAFIAAAMKASKQPQGGATPGLTMMKSDPDHSNSCATEEKLQGYRRPPSWNGHENRMPQKLHITAPVSLGQRTEQHSVRGSVAGEKRLRSAEAMELTLLGSHADRQFSPGSPSLPSHNPLFFLKNVSYPSSSSSPSSMADEKPARNRLHAPVPYRPRPIKTARLSLPWPLPEQPDWASLGPPCAVGVGLQQVAPLTESGRFLMPGKDPGQSGKQGSERSWADRGPPQPHGAALPVRRTVSAELVGKKDRTDDRGAAPIAWKPGARQTERIFGENLREAEPDFPLDLSDPGKGKPGEQQQWPYKASPGSLEQGVKEEGQASGTPHQTSPGSSCSSSLPPAHSSPSSASSASSPQQAQQGQPTPQRDTLEQDDSVEDKPELNPELSANTEQKNVPVLTISLHPVVVLDTFKPGPAQEDSCDGEMNLDLPPNGNLQEQSEDLLSSYERNQNGRRRTRGQFGREALQPRSPKDRRVKMSPGQQVKSHSDMDHS